MSGTGDVVTIMPMLIQAVTVGASVLSGGVALGLLDRWLTARRAARGDQRQDKEDKNSSRQKLMDEMEGDRDQARKERDAADTRREACEIERGRVWVAGRRMEDYAHKQMHQGNNRIAKAFAAGKFLAEGVEVDRQGNPIVCPADLPPPPALESFLPGFAAEAAAAPATA